VDFPETVTRACRVSGGTLPNGFSVVVPLTVDYRGATGSELSNLAMRSTVIEWQNPARSLSQEFLQRLGKEGALVHFRNAKNFVDPEKRVQELVATGMPEIIARMAVYEPAEYAEFMKDAATRAQAKK